MHTRELWIWSGNDKLDLKIQCATAKRIFLVIETEAKKSVRCVSLLFVCGGAGGLNRSWTTEWLLGPAEIKWN